MFVSGLIKAPAQLQAYNLLRKLRGTKLTHSYVQSNTMSITAANILGFTEKPAENRAGEQLTKISNNLVTPTNLLSITEKPTEGTLEKTTENSLVSVVKPESIAKVLSSQDSKHVS
jgi:hypothetical protein